MMSKNTILLFVLLWLPLALFAQEETAPLDTTYWTNSISANLTFNQASFSDNWKAGGVNSVALGALLNAKAKYEKVKISWVNETELQYGMVNNAGQGFRKSIDRILLDSKLGYGLSKKWNAFFSLNFLSQFANGFRYEENAQGNEEAILISKFMAPGFLTSSLGFEYKPADYFWLRLSPFSPRFTFVNDTEIIQNVPANYGVEPGESVRTEWLAFQLVADLDKDVAENLNLKARYMMYANYQEFDLDTIDHRFDFIATAKITKLINVNFNLIMLYDIDQDADVQLSQGLSVGLAYKISNR